MKLVKPYRLTVTAPLANTPTQVSTKRRYVFSFEILDKSGNTAAATIGGINDAGTADCIAPVPQVSAHTPGFKIDLSTIYFSVAQNNEGIEVFGWESL